VKGKSCCCRNAEDTPDQAILPATSAGTSDTPQKSLFNPLKLPLKEKEMDALPLNNRESQFWQIESSVANTRRVEPHSRPDKNA
jgi:hypothetical protein